MTTISIAMCSYQGARYLEEQLASLVAQEQMPMELIICDDCSIDGSAELINNFRKIAPFEISHCKNKRRLYIIDNFSQAIQMCRGDIILLCDQDDVWLPAKLAHFKTRFASGADWVCCDAMVTNSKLRPLGYTLWQQVNFNKAERNRACEGYLFEILLKHYVVAGATLAFRAELRDRLLPIPPEWHYDAWLIAVLAATAPGIIIEQPLQLYRQHDANVIGGIRRNLAEEARTALRLDRIAYLNKEIFRWISLSERLEALNAPIHYRKQLDAKIAHLKRRSSLPINRLVRLPKVVSELFKGGYTRYARNWGSIVLDLLIK